MTKGKVHRPRALFQVAKVIDITVLRIGALTKTKTLAYEYNNIM